MSNLSPSRLSAGTCDLCGNGPVAVAAIEARKEPMTNPDPAAILREALAEIAEATNEDRLGNALNRLADKAETHLPAVLAELAQLRAAISEVRYVRVGEAGVAYGSRSNDYAVALLDTWATGAIKRGFPTMLEALAWIRSPEGIAAVKAASRQPKASK